MISKEKFVETINRLRDYNDLQDKINDLFNKESGGIVWVKIVT